MNTLQKSPATASPGWSLGALVGTIAMLWIWTQIPAWAFLGRTGGAMFRALRQVYFHFGLLSMLLVLANATVLRWVTLSMALPQIQMEQAGPIDQTHYWKNDLVFWLGISFHLTTLVVAGWRIWQLRPAS